MDSMDDGMYHNWYSLIPNLSASDILNWMEHHRENVDGEDDVLVEFLEKVGVHV